MSSFAARRVTPTRRVYCPPGPPDVQEEILSLIADAGWEVVTDASQAGTCTVGLVIPCTSSESEALASVANMGAGTPLPWVAILHRDDLGHAPVRDLIAQHCYDFLTLPVDADRIRFSLGHASGMAALIRAQRLETPAGCADDIIHGISEAANRLRRDIAKLGRSEAPVLILGESGTGKELTSRAIHLASARRDRAFITVNCASLSPSLIHAELFGYERGAFTGAHQRQIGHLESATGGTILLDEIGDLHADLQVLLLRFLDERTLQRVGGRKTIHVDARVIAATHVNLEEAVREGRFREDLYHRLNVLSVSLPPLRERAGDVELLARQFLHRLQTPTDRPRTFSNTALAAMRAHGWPGNVRELFNRVHRAVVMGDQSSISSDDLGLALKGQEGGRHVADVRDIAEAQAVQGALERSGGNATRAAGLVGVSRATFYRMMDRRGMIANRRKSVLNGGVEAALAPRHGDDDSARMTRIVDPRC